MLLCPLKNDLRLLFNTSSDATCNFPLTHSWKIFPHLFSSSAFSFLCWMCFCCPFQIDQVRWYEKPESDNAKKKKICYPCSSAEFVWVVDLLLFSKSSFSFTDYCKRFYCCGRYPKEGLLFHPCWISKISEIVFNSRSLKSLGDVWLHFLVITQ